MVWRAYSITSTPADDFVEYLIVTVPTGPFTQALKKMVIGDLLQVDQQSFWFMTPDRFVDGDALWMIATGTGLGPFVSMLRERLVWDRFARLVLVHGARTSAELAYAEEFAAMVARPPFACTPPVLTVLHALTRDGATTATGLLHGRITTLLEGGVLESAAGLVLEVTQSRVMLCGNPAMIEDMRTLLHARQMRPSRRALPGQFVTENYW